MEIVQDESAFVHHHPAVAEFLRQVAEQARDPQITATYEAYCGAVSRLDDGIGTDEERARDEVIVKRFEASPPAYSYEDYEIVCWNADHEHTVKHGYEPDGGWWWECSWGGEGNCFDTEADMIADRDEHQHDEGC